MHKTLYCRAVRNLARVVSMLAAGFLLAAGTASAAAAPEAESQARDYPAVAAAINETMRAYHYNPAELDSREYRSIETALASLAATATTDDEFLQGFRTIWADGPFSHVSLDVGRPSAEALADHLDSLRVGGGGALLSWQDDVAILTVDTMMGLDTIEEIDAAYDEIAANATRGLIIDLRANNGGAFAVVPLVSHLLDQDYDAGGFVSQRWNAAHDRAPVGTDFAAVDPWTGWSIKAFWEDAQTDALTRIRFSPSAPRFDGPVYVLTSRSTASAAELAADALKGSQRARIIGERTAGEMLSQKMYDVAGGFQLSLPIADYYSNAHGRIEGAGVLPNIETDAADALAVALQQL